MHSKYEAEYDCPKFITFNGEKMYHQKGEGPSTCKWCERYRANYK